MFRNSILLIFSFFFLSTNGQKKSVTTIATSTSVISISTMGLDELILENSTSEEIEITLKAENASKQYILDEEKQFEFHIQFKFPSLKLSNEPFRKYITERLKRASAIIKIPMGKSVIIKGENCDIISSFSGHELSIDMLNSIIRIQSHAKDNFIRFHAGNLYVGTTEVNLDLQTKTGIISHGKVKKEKSYISFKNTLARKTMVRTIKGNIFLSNE